MAIPITQKNERWRTKYHPFKRHQGIHSWEPGAGSRFLRHEASLPGVDRGNLYTLMHLPFKSVGLFECGILHFYILLLPFQSWVKPDCLDCKPLQPLESRLYLSGGDIIPAFKRGPKEGAGSQEQGWGTLCSSPALTISLRWPQSYPCPHLALKACTQRMYF